MNAILQCFLHTPLVMKYFTSGLFKNYMKRLKEPEATLSSVIAGFAIEYERLKDLIEPLRKLKEVIGRYIPQFQGYDQHDAQEFLSMMIDKLTAELTIVRPDNFEKTLPSNGLLYGSPLKNPEKIESKVSVIGNLFCGELCSTVTCHHCKNCSETKEPFYYLSVPLRQRVLIVYIIRKLG